jgi:hypothetical protein
VEGTKKAVYNSMAEQFAGLSAGLIPAVELRLTWVRSSHACLGEEKRPLNNVQPALYAGTSAKACFLFTEVS